MEDPQQLEKLLLEFPLELTTQIQELLKLRQILNIQQVGLHMTLLLARGFALGHESGENL